MKYTILLGRDPSSLSTEVNNLLSHGWRPQGGVCIVAVRDEEDREEVEQWAQAMVKDSDSESDSSALDDEELLETQPQAAILPEDERIPTSLRLVHTGRAA